VQVHAWGGYISGFLVGKVIADLFYYAMIAMVWLAQAMPQWSASVRLALSRIKAALAASEHEWAAALHAIEHTAADPHLNEDTAW